MTCYCHVDDAAAPCLCTSVCLSVCVAVSVYVWSRHPTDRQLWLYRTQSLATLRPNSPQTPLVAPDEASIAFQLDYCNAVVPSPALWHAYSIVAAVCSVSYTLTSLIVRLNDTQLSSRVYVSSKGNFYSLFLQRQKVHNTILLADNTTSCWLVLLRKFPEGRCWPNIHRFKPFQTWLSLSLQCHVQPRRPYNLYCVGGDVKPCSIKSQIRNQPSAADRKFLAHRDLGLHVWLLSR